MPWVDWIWHSEIEPFPCAVMAARHPNNQNLGDILAPDFIERAKALGPLDIMVGGPPCQAFSIAGLRGSLSDPRGNLSLRWVQVLHAIRSSIAITENVPGWLSTADNAFGCFLAGIVGADAPLNSPLERGRWPNHGMVSGPLARAAWRVLDAQYVRTRSFPWAVPQRRRRVFVVISFGTSGLDPAAVLFDRESLRGNPAPRREAGQGVAPTIAARTRGGGGLGTDFDCDGGLIPNVSPALKARDYKGPSSDGDGDGDGAPILPVAHALRGEGFDASEDGTGRGTPIVPVAYPIAIQERAVSENPDAGPDGKGWRDDGAAYTLEARSVVQAVAVDSAFTFNTTQLTSPQNGQDLGPDKPCHSLAAKDHPPAVAFCQNTRDEVRLFGDDGQTVGALAAEPGMKQTCYVAQPEPFTIMERGRDGQSNLESRQDGTANAILTPNGGRGGLGVGAIAAAWGVRRLTPTECARLQGFPDDWARIPWRGKPADECPDGPQYKAYGNSMAVNCMIFLGERIQAVMEATDAEGA